MSGDSGGGGGGGTNWAGIASALQGIGGGSGGGSKAPANISGSAPPAPQATVGQGHGDDLATLLQLLMQRANAYQQAATMPGGGGGSGGLLGIR